MVILRSVTIPTSRSPSQTGNAPTSSERIFCAASLTEVSGLITSTSLVIISRSCIPTPRFPFFFRLWRIHYVQFHGGRRVLRKNPRESPLPVPKTPSAFHPPGQRNAFSRCDERQQSGSFAPRNQWAETIPQLQPALLRLSAMISQYFISGCERPLVRTPALALHRNHHTPGTNLKRTRRAYSACPVSSACSVRSSQTVRSTSNSEPNPAGINAHQEPNDNAMPRKRRTAAK